MNIAKILWPEVCVICGGVYNGGICPGCRRKLNKISVREPRCMKCGKPVTSALREYCDDCGKGSHVFSQGAAVWLYSEPVKRAIHVYKNNHLRCGARVFAEEMVSANKHRIEQWAPDVIVPVPLHKKKLRMRGYNQAELLGKEISRITGIPENSGILHRIRHTGSQKEMSLRQRKTNIKNAFFCDDLKKGAVVLLIDDVYTTGNTMDEAAAVLKRAGAKEVFFLTICIGQGY